MILKYLTQRVPIVHPKENVCANICVSLAQRVIHMVKLGLMLGICATNVVEHVTKMKVGKMVSIFYIKYLLCKISFMYYSY